MGVFSRVPDTMDDSRLLLEEHANWFTKTGLKKESIIKTEKITVVHNSIVRKEIGKLPDNILVEVREKLRKTLCI